MVGALGLTLGVDPAIYSIVVIFLGTLLVVGVAVWFLFRPMLRYS